MKMLLEDGIRYLSHDYGDEDELEQMVIEHSQILFGENSVFFSKQRIRTPSGIGTIPDGFVLLIDEKKWYVIEIELSLHPLYEHIVVQVSKFNSAIKNSINRRKLIDAFYDAVENNIQMKYKFEVKGITKELYKFLSDIINKEPGIIIVVDEKTKELDEVCATLPFQPTALEFKTYSREGVGKGVHIHFFDTLKDYEIEEEVIGKEKIFVKPKPSKGSETLMQVLDVAILVFDKGKNYNEAVKIVASDRKVREQTVMDKCTRRIGLDTAKFKTLLQDKNKMETFLIEKFSQDGEIIVRRLRAPLTETEG